VRSEDIRAYVRRRWDLIEAAKSGFWAREKAHQSPVEALRLADGLRRQALARHPDGPTGRERAEDLRSHEAVAKKLRLAGPHSNR
jgi:hypothetical protein